MPRYARMIARRPEAPSRDASRSKHAAVLDEIDRETRVPGVDDTVPDGGGLVPAHRSSGNVVRGLRMVPLSRRKRR